MNQLKEFINLCVSNSLLPLSWGIGCIVIGADDVSFTVNGSNYQGKVVIKNDIQCLKVIIEDVEEVFSEAVDAYAWLDQYIE